MSYYTGFLKSIFSGSYHLCFFPAYSFKTILKVLKIIILPAPSHNLHQQLFGKINRLPMGNQPEITVHHLQEINGRKSQISLTLSPLGVAGIYR